MIKWWRERSTQEKWMIALIAMLVVGIVVRWSWVSDEAAGAFRERFTVPVETEKSTADSVTRNLPADSLP